MKASCVERCFTIRLRILHWPSFDYACSLAEWTPILGQPCKRAAAMILKLVTSITQTTSKAWSPRTQASKPYLEELSSQIGTALRKSMLIKCITINYGRGLRLCNKAIPWHAQFSLHLYQNHAISILWKNTLPDLNIYVISQPKILMSGPLGIVYPNF